MSQGNPTRPAAEHLRFRSESTGTHVLDHYLEGAEVGGKTLAELMGILFTDEGVFDPSLIEFRVKADTRVIQYRIGSFASPELGWSDMPNSNFFKARGVYTEATWYNVSDIVTVGDNTYICDAAHSAPAELDASKWMLLLNGDRLQDISNEAGAARDAAQMAQTFAESAQMSSEAARDASQAARDASQTARDASQTAQAASEAARDAGIAAKTASETAQGLAEAARDKANQWADGAEDVEVEAGKYSAKHHAAKAEDSAITAAAHKAAAETSKTQAAGSATDAANSAGAADADRIAAETARTGAETAESGAVAARTGSESARDKAEQWAENPENVAVETGKYSALHHAAKANASEIASSSSEGAAAASASAASGSASAASLAQTNAETAETNAEASATLAGQYRDEAQQFAAVVSGAMVELGGWDASGGTFPAKPPDGSGGYISAFWKITVAGSMGGVAYGVGDSVCYSANLDEFFKIDNTESVTSVNGKQGIVLLSAADVGAYSTGEIDANLAGYLPLSGGKLSGGLELPGGPLTGVNLNNASYLGTNNNGRAVWYAADDIAETQNGWLWRTLRGGGGRTDVATLSIEGTMWTVGQGTLYGTGNKPTPAELGASASGHTHSYLPLSGGTVTGSVGVDGNVTAGVDLVTDRIRPKSGQQLSLCAGEAHSYAPAQTYEYIYLNSEGGLEINSSPDNWGSGWAGRNTARICKEDGSSDFPGSIKSLAKVYNYAVGGWFYRHWNIDTTRGVSQYVDEDGSESIVYLKGVLETTPTATSSQNVQIRLGKADGSYNQVFHQGFLPTPGQIGAATSGHTHDYIQASTKGLLGDSNSTPGDTTNWPNNPAPGSYLRDYVGYGGAVLMSGDVSSSTSSFAFEFAYDGQLWVHSNTDSNRWQSYRIFNESYHPNADKWTTARTLTLTGDVTGSVSMDGSGNVSMSTAVGNDSHTHAWGNITGKPSSFTPSSHGHSYITGDTYGANIDWLADNVPAGQMRYDASSTTTSDGLPLSDNANGVITVGQHSGKYTAQLAFSSNGGMYWRDNPSTSQGSWRRLFEDSYHPNADKWTTARKLTISGDGTGSVTMDGSGDVTLSLDVTSSNWADKVDVNTSTSTSTYSMLWHSGDTVYSTNGKGPKFRPSDGWTEFVDDVTMRYNLTLGGGSSYNPWLTIHGADGSTERTGISIGESGKWGSACLHIYYTGDGYAHIGMGGMTGTTHASNRAMQFHYQSTAVTFFGAATINGHAYLNGGASLDDNDYLYFGSGNDVEFFCNGSHMYTDLNSGIGNWYIRDGSTTRFTFDDAGHFTATGNVTAYSDKRVKANFEVIGEAMAKVRALTGYTFDRTDGDVPRQTGLIAQDVEQVLPEAVTYHSPDGEERLGLAYGNMAGLFVEALKEQDKVINDLTSRLEKLEAMIGGEA